MDDAKLSRAMTLSVAEGGLATVMGSLIGGVFLTGFALVMGASQLQIGILAGMPVLANFSQLVGALIIERTGSTKRLCVLSSLSSRLLWLPAVIIPLWLFPIRNGDAVWVMIVAIGVSNVLASVSGIAWLTWTKDLIPISRRINYFGQRNLWNTGLSVTAGLLGAFFLDWYHVQWPESIGSFVIVFAVAIVCGLVSWWLQTGIPEANRFEKSREPLHHVWFTPLKDRNFRYLVAFYSFWNLSVHIAQPFFSVYMLTELGMPFLWVTGLATLSSTLALLTNNLWSRLSERYGTKPIVMIATCCDVAIPLCWLFVTPERALFAILIHCAGFFSAPLATGPNNLLLSLAPTKSAAPYLGIFNATVGTATAVASIAGGALATFLAESHLSIGSLTLNGLKVIFLLSFAGRLASLVLLSLIREPNAVPVVAVLQSIRRIKPVAVYSDAESPAQRAA